MNKIISGIILLIGLTTNAAYADQDGDSSNGDKIYQIDAYGKTQYHKNHYTIEGDRLIETNAYGRKQYHKPGYKIESGKVYETNKSGRTQYHKPAYKTP